MLLLVIIPVVALALLPAAVLAHPLGNFTINRYAGLLVQPNAITLDYVIDMAEIPAYQEMTTVMNSDGRAVPDAARTDPYRANKCAQLPAKFSLAVNGAARALALTDSALEFPPGAAGLLTLRLTCTFRAELENLSAARTLTFNDANFSERIGWREMVVRGEGVALRDTNARTTSLSNRLRDYPTDLINDPPRESNLQLSFQLAAASTSSSNAAPRTDILNRTQDAFAALIAVNDLNVPFMLLALLLAMGLGALHAVSPGHGKTIMAAYLVSTHGTLAQALALGLTVTVTHTLGVLVLGVITLFASEYVVPETLYPFLSLSSGVLVIGMGASLAFDRWRRFRWARRARLHEHEHARHAEHEHSHADEIFDHEHSHLPDAVIRDGLSWKSLFGLGLAGGLVPSTSALILLLSAISLHRIPFGIVLIIAFGLGMALVLVGIGVVIVRASHFLEQRKTPAQLMAWMPLASAVVVVGAGIFVTVQALAQLGWLKL